MSDSWPSYLELHESGELRRRRDQLTALLSECRLCPHECRVNRVAGERGFCRAPGNAVFSAASAHHGEEPVLSGSRGSGTIFFTHCNSRCLFCQNYDISQLEHGKPISAGELADIYLALQQRGCHNVNFVTPAHFIPQIVQALDASVSRGFRLPLVYNSNGFDSVEVLRLLDGIFDIYLPDMKYGDEALGRRLSQLAGYPEAAKAAIAEMFRQVGPLDADDSGIARRGVIVRHLVLPNHPENTKEALRILADIDKRVAVSLMGQYHPAYRAREAPELVRRLTAMEYRAAAGILEELGLESGWTQDLHLLDNTFLPDFPGRKWRLED